MVEPKQGVFLTLTRNSTETIIKRGGSAYWCASAKRIANDCRFVIATRNARDPEAEGDEEHGAALHWGNQYGLR